MQRIGILKTKKTCPVSHISRTVGEGNTNSKFSEFMKTKSKQIYNINVPTEEMKESPTETAENSYVREAIVPVPCAKSYHFRNIPHCENGPGRDKNIG